MRAMILAAGLGTRLHPLTDNRPKALVEIEGRSLLEIALARLRSFGIREVIVNVHHFADQVIEHLRAHGNFGLGVEISREDELLDTGGGIKKAAWFLKQGGADEPFLVHNVDVLSSIDLERMLESHRNRQALATLAVQRRESSRRLLFDDHLQLCGRQSRGAAAEMTRPETKVEALAFCGIHVISPRIFSLLKEEGVFPIVPAYLRFAGQGERVMGFRADEYYWRDLGTVESLEQAGDDIKNGTLRQLL
jgi:NDP-sugar pyrophosphorylase family protein